jgi:DNA-binding MarR family transcriptional regulator
MRISARQAEQDLGISGAQLFVLQKLSDRPANSLNELAERTLTHQSSVSVVVQRLVDRGLVARDRSEGDARRIELRLTGRGRRLLSRVRPVPQVDLVDAIREMKDQHLLLVARLMHDLARATHSVRLRPEMMFAEAAGENGGSQRVRRRR